MNLYFWDHQIFLRMYFSHICLQSLPNSSWIHHHVWYTSYDLVSLYWNKTMWPLLLVEHLYWNHYMARLVVVNGHQNDTHEDEVEICAQILITIIISIVNTIRRVYVVPWKKDPLIPTFFSHNLASWETSNLKLETIVYLVCNY